MTFKTIHQLVGAIAYPIFLVKTNNFENHFSHQSLLIITL